LGGDEVMLADHLIENGLKRFVLKEKFFKLSVLMSTVLSNVKS
jgi:hypothetical protein